MKRIFAVMALLFAVTALSGMHFTGGDNVHNLKIIAFGDSITQGSALTTDMKNWTELLSERYGTEIINAGVAGNSSAQGLARLERDVLSLRPDLVIINFGMNDSVLDGPHYVAVSQFADNITQIVEEIRKAGAMPVLVTPNPIIEGNETSYYYSRHNKAVFTPYGGAQTVLNTYVQCIREIAKGTGTPLADVNREWRNYNSFDLLITLKNSDKDDGVHPCAAGAELYARIIGDVLYNLTM
ncbi:MAG: GDSL-type esterase/lipase family protein [Firmicutes bacterium]|nr:GDSL-type esterase/lipase family protein [Bacillota bacterium]